MQIVSGGENLHEMSNLIFCENKKNIYLSSAEFVQRVIKDRFSSYGDKVVVLFMQQKILWYALESSH